MSDDATPNPRLARWQTGRIEVTGAWKEKRRLAAAMRSVISRLVEIEAPEAELAAAADGLERYAARLASHPRPNRYEGWSETSASGDVGSFFDHSPLIGLSNPLAPPIELRAGRGRPHACTAARSSAPPTRARRAACTAATSRPRSTRCSASRTRSPARPA